MFILNTHAIVLLQIFFDRIYLNRSISIYLKMLPKLIITSKICKAFRQTI